MIQVSRIARFSLTTADAPALAAFYQAAFGCVPMSDERQAGTMFEEMTGVRGGARRIALALGQEIIEMLQFDHIGAPYPATATASDLCFQHFAIVVRDMARAWERLAAMKGWRAITKGGPQKLPATSGGVTAFKFRDPEGHPLEFLIFPPGRVPAKWQNSQANGCCLGLDHSAISISDSNASVQFYSALGLAKAGFSENHGPTQDALDGLDRTQVEVTTLEPTDPTPHLELLAYRGRPDRQRSPVANNDIACTRLLFEAVQARPQSLTDPDGHHLIIMPKNQDYDYSSQSRSTP